MSEARADATDSEPMRANVRTSSPSSRLSAWWPLAALLALGGLTSCLYDGGPLEERLCEGPDQLCPEGFVCVDGYCADADAVDLPPEEDVVEEPEVDVPDEEVDPNSFCIDDDGDGFTRDDVNPLCPLPRELADCDSSNARNPNAAEVCDGVDNDCDRKIDAQDELTDPQPCEQQLGVCEGAMKVCRNGAYQPCGQDEYSDAAAGKGAIYLQDEAFCSKPQGNQPRLKANGTCTTGGVNPEVRDLTNAENVLCDGTDNDCDGVVDDPADVAIPCYLGESGASLDDATLGRTTGFCKAGARQCVGGSYETACANEQPPVQETTGELRCDEIDQDCDGSVGEDCTCDPGEVRDCYTGPQGSVGRGVCRRGTQTCLEDNSGFGACLGEVTPNPEACDNMGADDDCNGEEDDIRGFTYGATCGQDRLPPITSLTYDTEDTGQDGICEQGTMKCDGSCADPSGFCCVSDFQVGQFPETCDDRNVDNDCDGSTVDIDLNANTPRDDIAVGGSCQTGQDGICAEGRWACPNVADPDYPTCNPLYTPLAQDIGNTLMSLDEDRMVATCNTRDDDCDGDVDEDTDFTLEPNCGQCGVRCGSNQECCPPALGATPTDYECTTYRTPLDPDEGDENNCGGCGFDEPNDPHLCGVDQRCCSETCVDYLIDENNCGSCGNTCAGNQQCCNGGCINLNDATNCGACDNDCADQMNTVCCLPQVGAPVYDCFMQADCDN